MQKVIYTFDSMERSLDAYERRFELTSAAFYRAYERNRDDASLAHVPQWQRHSWASFYREWREPGGDFAASVERELAV